MKKILNWLDAELPRWVSDGVVTADQAKAIRGRYPDTPAAAPWAIILFSGFGAVIIGLGVILFLAHNWENIPRLARLGILLAGVAGAHAGGWRLAARGGRLAGVGEALALLGTMLFGAGIWLVAQMYHIDEHFPNGFLFWAIGALAAAWAYPSVAQGVLATVLVTTWAGTECVEFESAMHVAPAMILLLLGGLAWRLRSRVLIGLVIPAFTLSCLFVVGAMHTTEGFAAGTAFHIGVLLVAAGGVLSREKRFPGAAPVLAAWGWVIAGIVLYLLTFEDLVGEFVRMQWNPSQAGPIAYWGITGAVAVGLWIVEIRRRLAAGERWMAFLERLLLPLSVVLVLGCGLLPRTEGAGLAVVAFNLLFLVMALVVMRRGCTEGRTGVAIVGSLLLVALTVARFFDCFGDLLTRSIIFCVVGGVIFAEGVRFARVRRRKETGG